MIQDDDEDLFAEEIAQVGPPEGAQTPTCTHDARTPHARTHAHPTHARTHARPTHAHPTHAHARTGDSSDEEGAHKPKISRDASKGLEKREVKKKYVPAAVLPVCHAYNPIIQICN